MRKLSALLGLLFLLSACAPAEPVRSESFVMNTFLVQTVYGSEEAAQKNVEIARELERKFSRTIADSEIARLTAEGKLEVTEDTRIVLAASLEAMDATGGAYDPRLGALRALWGFGEDSPEVPDSAALHSALAQARQAQVTLDGAAAVSDGADLDLGGAAKGYALDKMRENLISMDVPSALIDFGGALLVLGAKPDGSAWRIGVRDPLSAQGNSIAEFACTDICMETSGISQQNFEQEGVLYHHLLDPATGYPAQNSLASVTVLSEDGLTADIYATALFVMGLDDGLAFADLHNIAVLFITRERELIASESFPYEITITDNAFRKA